MNKIILTLTAVMILSFAACAQNKGEKSMLTENKPLVVYFSATGTTAKAARTIAEVTGGTLYEIVPQQAYTSDDLDWNDKQSRSSVEMNNPQARPTLKDTKLDVTAYDVVFIGYPIWWDLAPRIINTFIESYGLKGKTLVPFATSGGSGISNSVRELRKTYPNLEWQDGKLLNGSSRNAIQNWTSDVMKNSKLHKTKNDVWNRNARDNLHRTDSPAVFRRQEDTRTDERPWQRGTQFQGRCERRGKRP